MGLREDKKRETKEALFVSTMELFRQVGFEEARVQDVAAKVRVSLKTFYNYFPTKDAVLDEYVMRVLDGSEAQLRDASRDTRRSAVKRLRKLILDLASLIDLDPDFAITVFRRSSLFRPEGAMLDKQKEIYRLIAAIFVQGQERGEIRPDVDPMVMTESLLGVYYFTATNWIHGWWPDDASLVDRLRVSLGVFETGCRAAGGPSR